jgi:hypothetical protein
MDKNPIDKIYEMIRTAKIVPHKKRQEFLCDMIGGVIKSRSVVFSEISDKIDKPIKVSSLERRIQDFFAKVRFDYTQLAIFLLSFLPQRPLVLSIDRTEWDFGKTQVNILCAVVSIGKMAVPIYFEMLDNKSGNSNAADRITLFKSLIATIGKPRIQPRPRWMLVMDREFIGHTWLSCGSPPGLKRENIPFCVRVPKHHSILLTSGDRLWAEKVMHSSSQPYYQQNAIVDGVAVNLSLSYGKDGELLYLIGSTLPQTLQSWYKRRWSIEVFFQALKQRGYNLEGSSLRCIIKYRKLFALVCMAYTIYWATGIEAGKTNPVRVKKHGYPQYSVFRRGLNLMRQFYKQQVSQPLQQAVDAAWVRFGFIYKTVG